MLTFVTTAWAGARPIYEPWHIVNVDHMLHRHVTIPFRHVVVTDQPDAHRAAGIEAVPLWPVNAPHLPAQTRRCFLNNWVRLGLFDFDLMLFALDIGIDDVLVSIDADIVIRRNIDHLFRDLPAFKIMSLKSRCHLQGGLFAVRPGQVEPNPWRVLHDEPDTVAAAHIHGGSDQALLTHLFYGRADVATWNEDDGLAINAQHDDLDWSLFFRTGHKKCWDTRMPEAREYYAQSGRDIETEARPLDPMAPPLVGPSRSPYEIRAGHVRKFRVEQIAKRTKP